MSAQDDFMNLSDVQSRSALLQMITGYWTSQAIYVAAKLGIADLLKDGPKSCDILAKSTETSQRELFRLLRYLASIGIFAEVEDTFFELTPLAAYLQSETPSSLRSLVIYYGEETYQPWGSILHSIKTGETAFNQVHKSGVFQYFAQYPESAAVFNQAMTEYTAEESIAVINAYDFSKFDKIVDVGGGQGSFMATILKANDEPKGILFDLPQGIGGAKEYLDTEDLIDRCEIIEGDFFKSIPSGGDAYIFKNIFVNWDDERCIDILKNCHHAMAENGKLIIAEVSVISPKNTPSFSKLFDLHMLVMTGGRGRTEAEFQALFVATGFNLTNIIPTESPVSIIEGVRM
ncbi:MAG: methyltransferase [Deltaproteobacteria bacterium]|nr:methyltransferase [Deltaproteobacteria bacterium]